MLLPCPECGNQVSSKALFCPACGYPIQEKPQTTRRSRSKRRLPNGFGSITYLKGRKLRNPYLARVTIGKTDKGKPIVRNLHPNAYFKTYNDAYNALIEFNRNPYSFDKDLSVRDTFGLFLAKFKEENHTAKYVQAIERAYRRSESLYDMKLRDIRPRHIKACIETCGDSPNEKQTLKQLWNRLFDYAIEYELADHNYARDFSLDNKSHKKNVKKNSHQIFTDEEMKVLWENRGDEIVRIILVQCYMGWRPNEICSLTQADVDLKQWTATYGSKTEAGMNRTVPIHTKIRPLVEEAVNEGHKFVFTIQNEAIDYFRYRYYFRKTIKRLGLNEVHKPHDPRKQFVTMAKRSEVDEYVIKRLVGHAINDVTESTYTDRDIEWLRTELEKITL